MKEAEKSHYGSLVRDARNVDNGTNISKQKSVSKHERSKQKETIWLAALIFI